MEPPSANSAAPGASAALIRTEVKARVRAVIKAARKVRSSGDGPDVHRLRVATRRAEAALRLFAPVLPDRKRRRLRRALKKLRSAAGVVRDADVHLAMLGELAAASPDDALARLAIEHVTIERDAAVRSLRRRCRRSRRERLDGLGRALLRTIDAEGPIDLSSLGRRALDQLTGAVRDAAARDLGDIAALHVFRLAVKRLRYAAELMENDLHLPTRAGLREHLKSLQNRLGEVNDADSLVHRIERPTPEPSPASASAPTNGVASPSLAPLAHRYRRLCTRRHAAFLEWWTQQGRDQTLSLLTRPSNAHASPPSEVLPAAAPTTGELFPPRRFGAIDVGSNSIRLLLAEVHGDGRMRVIDDEKETTRLAQGLHKTGRLSDEAMTRSAEVIWRLAGIARGYGVASPRAIATSAVRDATNAAEFVDLVARTTSLKLDVISAEQEGRLAFRSAATAFDLADNRAAVVDIGGGSAQIVLSDRGVIDQLHTLQLGAVRLTERFGGAKAAAGRNLRAIADFVDDALAREVGPLPIKPEIMIGTGGTMSALGAMSLALRQGPAGADAAFTRIQGTEVARADLKEIIERLADLPLPARARFPGLPADRADIIIAGLIVAHRIMKHLGVRRVVIHQGGIRAGLLREMADEALGPSRGETPRRDPIDGMRALARSLSYELEHSEHVAGLALSIFDQLAAREPDAPWADSAARLLLHGAAILHDIGYAIGYEDHHKHSYQIIMHSDLPGLTSRQIELIAVISRYHRRAEPSREHACFARLSAPDRALVKRLSAILRVADGLDRTHSRQVRSVGLSFDGPRLTMRLEAMHDPTTDIWGAQRKSGLLERAFSVELAFEWAQAAASPPTEEPVDLHLLRARENSS